MAPPAGQDSQLETPERDEARHVFMRPVRHRPTCVADVAFVPIRLFLWSLFSPVSGMSILRVFCFHVQHTADVREMKFADPRDGDFL